MTDSNLILGLLALQHGFVSRDQLVSAVSVWTTDKSQSIGKILEENGSLANGVAGLLVHLTEAHLANHGNEPGRLAVLAVDESVEEDLMKLGDADIEATLAGTPAGSTTIKKAADQGATLAFTNRETTASGRFQKLRPHAEGGIGEVWVALDQHLNREVALKEIKVAFAGNDDSRARFMAEAEITGGLEHPGIVPVYAVDHDDQGRSSYAMRFIRGNSLKEAADEFHENHWRSDSQRSLELRKLLRRMIDVCNTMQYAHSRGVLHRDLKPANVVLGKFGETLVVDWGLAKSTGRRDDSKFDGEITLQPASGSSSTPTQFGKAIGTPAYMPPEQAAGRLTELSPESDVYSLGATLYYVLTGQPPHTQEELGAILRSVQDGKFKPPRQIKSHIAKPLEAICLKAMKLDKEDRYRTPSGLADDIERFLADEPVASYSEPLAIRSRRWMRRHPKSVAGLATTFLVGVASTIAIAIVVSGKNQELAAKNSELRDAIASRKQATDLAKKKTKEAADAKQEVAAIYNAVRQISKAKTLPGETLEVRQKLFGEKWMAFELLWALSQSKLGKTNVTDFKKMFRQVTGGDGKKKGKGGITSQKGVKTLLDIFGRITRGKKDKVSKGKKPKG